MYKHILIAIDGSDIGTKALNHGLSLAKALDAEVTIVTVSEPYPIEVGGGFAYAPSPSTMDDYRSSQEGAANALFTAALQAAEDVGVPIRTVHVADALPGVAILDVAKSHNCDLITMGSHGRRGLGRLLLGSKAAEVVTHAHVPVLVVR